MKDKWDELAEYLGKAIAKRWFAISSGKNRQGKNEAKTNGRAKNNGASPVGAETETTPSSSRPTLAKRG